MNVPACAETQRVASHQIPSGAANFFPLARLTSILRSTQRGVRRPLTLSAAEFGLKITAFFKSGAESAKEKRADQMRRQDNYNNGKQRTKQRLY